MQSRTSRVIGEENVKKLSNSNIAVLGVGGVGGYVVEMFARLGVKNLTIVDFDTISVSNLNRQIIALKSNINCLKVEEFKNRILNINPDCFVAAVAKKLQKKMLEKF